MIKRKAKFVQTSFETEELGARNALMQDYKSGHASGNFTGVSTLDDKIKSAQERLNYVANQGNDVGKEIKQQQLEAAKLVYDNLMKQKSDEQHRIEEKEKSEKDIEVAKINRSTTLEAAHIEKDTKIKTATIEKDTQIATAKIQQDPNQISQTEMDVFNLVKKYDFLKDPEAFKNLVNTSTDIAVKTDALTLEKDLKKLGAHLKVDGKIDQNTIDAVEALISKNAPAIKTYKEVTGIDPLRPSEGGAKPVSEREVH